MTQPDLQIISLGAGVQSSVLALLASRGELPQPDAAIFADTGWEPAAIYTHLDWLETQLAFPVYRVSKGSIKHDLIASGHGQRFASIPFFTSNGGIGNRQCTSEYKIQPIRKHIRKLLGLKPYQRCKAIVYQWIGITLDEVVRMKPARDKWITNTWPLIDLGMSRGDCLRWWQHHYPHQPLIKSACIGCPYRDNKSWARMKQDQPALFAEACAFDGIIRDAYELSGLKYQRFMHRSLQPLRDVDFTAYTDQLDLFSNECEGMCGL